MSDRQDREEILDRQVYREREHLTAGASALHALDPAEMAMRLEEAGADPTALHARDVAALRVEILAGLLEYFLAEGPHPGRVRDRFEGALRSFCPALEERMHGPREWLSEEEVGEVLRRYRRELTAARSVARSRGALAAWWEELRAEPDMETVAETLAGLLRYWVSEGFTWRVVTSVTLCLAKALRPHLIGGMSLEDIARLSGDAGGRATPSDRIRRLYNRRIEAAGMLGSYVHFQKSATTCARYAEAQRGNRNRAAAKPTKRRRRRAS